MEKIAARFKDSKESIFSRMTRLAQEKKALNLAQGFPDFPGPAYLIERMHAHLDACPNQYTRAAGHPVLCEALRGYAKRFLPREYDANDEITVVNGATEGILCAIVGLVDPGKKILVFEPYYESYLGCARIASAELVGVPLVPPTNEEERAQGQWHIDWSRFDQAMANDVALIMLNHPHNPTGKVFTHDELERIFMSAQARNIPVAIDGVYERLVYPPFDKKFTPFLARYGDNIIFISAISKTLSFTGFKIGWVFAPKAYTRAIRAVHDPAVFCQAPHMQLAVADMINNETLLLQYGARLTEDFLRMRDEMRVMLTDFGFRVPNAQGSYFLLAQKHRAPLNANFDHDLAMELLDRYKVATIPISGFYVDNGPKDWLRFAFCKRPETVHSLKQALLRS